MAEDHLSNLPVEILRHIFQYCDTETILFKLGSVCKRLRLVAFQYDAIKLEINRENIRNFKAFCHLIPAYAVTSIDMLCSYGYIEIADVQYCMSQFGRFTQIQQLILRIDSNHRLHETLKYLNGIQSILLTIKSYERPGQFTCSLMPPIITGLNLQKLCWANLDYKLEDMPWPPDCKLNYLAMNSCLYSQYTSILHKLPHLKTLRLNKMIMDNDKTADVPFTSRLTSLIIEDCSLSMEHLKLLVSKTPALPHLKLAFHEKILESIGDIYDWEKFVRTELSFLNEFEFFISYTHSFKDMISLDLFVVPFQQSFWLIEKHWFVVCEFVFKAEIRILLYTSSSHTSVRRDQFRSSMYGILFKQNNYYITERRENKPIEIMPCNVNGNIRSIEKINVFYLDTNCTRFVLRIC